MGRRKNARPVNGILLLDKPTGVSSNHALQTVKRLFNANKAGHTGTLDPLATGMLPICLGEATKISQYLLNSQKAYRANARLGQMTDTGDVEGQVVESIVVAPEVITALPERCQQFIGPGSQIPPMYSALKINGQRLYKIAREGKSVTREPRAVTIHSLDLLAADANEITVETVCSSGTYVRTLVEDLAKSAGSLAHLTALRRLWVSPFESAEMITIETLESLSPHSRLTTNAGDAGKDSPAELVNMDYRKLDGLLLSMDAALTHLDAVNITTDQAERFRQGQFIDESELSLDGRGPEPLKVICESELIGLAAWKEDRLKPVRVFNLQ